MLMFGDHMARLGLWETKDTTCCEPELVSGFVSRPLDDGRHALSRRRGRVLFVWIIDACGKGEGRKFAAPDGRLGRITKCQTRMHLVTSMTSHGGVFRHAVVPVAPVRTSGFR